MKKCINCGKMNPSNAETCVRCQCEMFSDEQPTACKNDSVGASDRITPKRQKQSNPIRETIVILVCAFVIYLIFDSMKGAAQWLAATPFIIAIAAIFIKLQKDSRNSGWVPNKENIEFCPRCKGRNLKRYRKGYDWNKGFWLRMFDIKGGSYIAGMEGNRVMCHCKDCGKTWKTDYDYRKL